MTEEELARIERDCGYSCTVCEDIAALVAEVRRLRKALEAFVVAVEGKDCLLNNSGDVWDAYESARVVLGHPVATFPGGYEDVHFHLYEWKDGDFCDTCDDYQADQRQEPAGE